MEIDREKERDIKTFWFNLTPDSVDIQKRGKKERAR
jgi:hypothetical protein